ncbi:hypothetical protein VTJ49DRAFT_3753 [Mycothermus thermophilus]|uniref:Uncharacterized protein n=1 Tax=Humicola insolens TaxID=85995 RepID=A0ABR3V6S6_HUMIN
MQLTKSLILAFTLLTSGVLAAPAETTAVAVSDSANAPAAVSPNAISEYACWRDCRTQCNFRPTAPDGRCDGFCIYNCMIRYCPESRRVRMEPGPSKSEG